MSRPGRSSPDDGIPAAEERLLRHVDGRLHPDEQAALAAMLAGDPELRRRVAADRAADTAIRVAFAPVLEEPVPERLRRAVRDGAVRRRELARMAAAVLLALLVGSGGGWLAGSSRQDGAPAETLAEAAMAAHRTYAVEVRHPVEVAATEEAHLVQWLSRRLGARLVAPDLSRFGYALMGGRLLPASDGPAAQLMYEARDGRRLTLYLEAERGDGETAFRFVESGKLSGFWWREEGLGYALLAETDREHLLPIARGVWEAVQRGS